MAGWRHPSLRRQGVSAYVEALLERTADGIDELTRTLRRSEENREAAASANAMLVERLAALAEAMRSQQTLLARLAEHSVELRGTVSRLSERSPESDREALQTHQRNIEANLARLVEESVRGRTALADELRGEFRLLARTIASTRGQGNPTGEG
jgi:septal ring factor EnvC (AmiA/AmiB activator)